MPDYFHGTGRHAATDIQRNGMQRGAFVTTDFDLAASYALRHGADAAIVVLAGEVAEPAEQVYDNEFIALSMRVVRVLRTTYQHIPDDFYELDMSLSGRKYPHLYQKENWR